MMKYRKVMGTILLLCALAWLAPLSAEAKKPDKPPKPPPDGGSAEILIGPYLQNATDTSIVVMWKATSDADSLVEFGQTFGGATFSVWSAHHFDALGCERIVSMWQQGGPSMPPGQGVFAAENVLPAWAGAARPGADFPDGAQVCRHVDARGWPMLAVRSSLQFTMPRRASGSPTLQQMVTVSGGFLHPGDRNTP